MSELKPCPFCGQRAKIVRFCDHDSYQIRCTNKLCNVATVFDDEAAVIAVWNKRAESEDKAND